VSEDEESSTGQEPKTKLAVVIMAASDGSQLKSHRPKVLHEIGGEPLISHVIAATKHIVDAADIYVVVGHRAERVKAATGATGVRFIDQTDQRGIGDAWEAIAGYENILVLPGDVPLIQPETIQQLWQFHQAEQAAMTVLSPDRGKVEVIDSGIYAFKTVPLLEHLGELTANNTRWELDLTEMAGLLNAAGERVIAFGLAGAAAAGEALSANTIAQLATMDATLRAAAANRLMAAGVTIFRPETCVIDSGVEVAPDTVIEPFVQLLGSTRIGAECLIRSYSVVENCTLGNNVLVRQSCILAESTIDDGAKIGPFAHLRPGSKIGEDAHVGNFVETKKATLGKGAKANHLTYLGDAEVGAGSNIGAGVITCNYDGVNKHQTHIGEGVFVGSDSTLVAPINVKDGAYIGAGSCITKDVPAGALAVGRAHQVIKAGWVAVRRARQASHGKKPRD
jgi:bifunctional UDP-N-acetylglucosamine pyrophosphorylase/glucosamine-1-phosphate N-acetyltransferase